MSVFQPGMPNFTGPSSENGAELNRPVIAYDYSRALSHLNEANRIAAHDQKNQSAYIAERKGFAEEIINIFAQDLRLDPEQTIQLPSAGIVNFGEISSELLTSQIKPMPRDRPETHLEIRERLEREQRRKDNSPKLGMHLTDSPFFVTVLANEESVTINPFEVRGNLGQSKRSSLGLRKGDIGFLPIRDKMKNLMRIELLEIINDNNGSSPIVKVDEVSQNDARIETEQIKLARLIEETDRLLNTDVPLEEAANLDGFPKDLAELLLERDNATSEGNQNHMLIPETNDHPALLIFRYDHDTARTIILDTNAQEKVRIEESNGLIFGGPSSTNIQICDFSTGERMTEYNGFAEIGSNGGKNIILKTKDQIKSFVLIVSPGKQDSNAYSTITLLEGAYDNLNEIIETIRKIV